MSNTASEADSFGVPVSGPAFDRGESLSDMLAHMDRLGLQATEVGKAITLLTRVRRQRDEAKNSGPEGNSRRVGLVLAYTSNMVSSGLREVFSYMINDGFVDAVVATAGGLEEDIIKCLGRTIVGDFALRGNELRAQGMNRVGNLIIPNANYQDFEDFFVPVVKSMHVRQCETRCEAGTIEPSALLHAVGDTLVNAPGVAVSGVEDSVVAACYRSNVPAFCPAFTDGSMGDMMFFYNINNPGMIVDALADERKFRKLIAQFDDVHVLSVGAGLPKHNALRACVAARNLRSVVLMTTSSHSDGCTSSGDRGDDLTDGQLLADTEYVRIVADATIVLPMLVSQAFAPISRN